MSAVETNATQTQPKTKEQLKAERRAQFEAQRAQQLNDKSTEKSKPMTKSERRALQEAQRAAKKEKTLSEANAVKPLSSKSMPTEKSDIKQDCKKEISDNSINDAKSNTPLVDAKSRSALENKQSKKLKIFPHIPSREENINICLRSPDVNRIHPLVIQVGLRMNKALITESTPRCVAMLTAFKSLIKDYETPPQKELSRDLKEVLDKCKEFLDKCRPLSISMCNAMKMLKMHLTKITPQVSDKQAKENLISAINEFIHQEIELALDAMSDYVLEKINSEDVILTFGSSHSVRHILKKALDSGKKFRVIVVDSRPKPHAEDMLQFLVKNNVQVTYVLINAAAYVMKEVTKVLLGAHSILANGYVMAKLGSSQIALVAQAYNVPVLVCCEGYKFSEKVLTDSFVYNEAEPDMFESRCFNEISNNKMDSLSIKMNSKLNILNLIYDVTPPDFVSMVVTEKGIIPCNSVPAVIRRNVTKFQ
ncbi:translation initiation factor eIF-2B subunit delta-like isoform X2 [Dinothrombium tinctorium]|uniref:Translation initiation factor eIF2B subunit delta n=1 Tax=Dinothrombium tinctorium TaxID=1965070 RepID=A0A3S3SN45_9ACAR|nr:translation initiation factor eIF-2B subunit delta-like isoform X2 [Dinothrombium tinctorium]RWS17025.1 translation initiation factor eIF-2B subunit delta-like isoform X2 [Dinothrombium tinctorium]